MLRGSGGFTTGLSKSNIPVRIWPVQNGSLNAEEKTFDTLRGGLRREREEEIGMGPSGSMYMRK